MTDAKIKDIQVLDFGNMKKKTKKPAATASKTENDDANKAQGEKKDSQVDSSKNQEIPVEKKDFEPQYYQLLDRINDILKRNNPSLQEGKTKISIKTPQIEKMGKKTAWLNFMDIVNKMKRDPQHVQQFVVTELGTEGTIANNQLILKSSKFNDKHFESIIKKYIAEYVQCSLCKSPNTKLTKDTNTRLFMIECDQCKSSRSVATIKKH
ncbi:domain found in IF2B/IF5 protein (macronuclear) [Tetrahymena thermophila SB210]|uniref:Domain found in IF2B/IF5 protein n=1 Tax=Tetrahymena thermophila (strain SB210) TaxID=312017 RepID=I7LXR4_TETTS|nr:domain found in IF2B/IF5 protein [Tetrahymena thermophila SB210]EAS05981.2 domain found in IF2B/IF5 protein [Tetrahymena thermophila SB210]|eukprot:XP_001026226.2 domain found in IF2B/IF5 protein [Tetrahymena thermophila SB210]